MKATLQTLLKRPLQRSATIQLQQTMSLTTDSFAFYPVPRNRVVKKSQTSDAPRECFSYYPSDGAERYKSLENTETVDSAVIQDAKLVRAALMKNKKEKEASREQERSNDWDKMVETLFEEKMKELGFDGSMDSTKSRS